jgi:hypothetical protein
MKTYSVAPLTRLLLINAKWDKYPWNEIPALKIDQVMDDKPDFVPDVQAKLAYDDDAIYAIFRVDDRYICARAKSFQDRVCEDSCVEFFFTPGPDIAEGYFNLEVNCGGTALFRHQRWRDVDEVPICEDDFYHVWLEHTMPKIVDPEITQPVVWVIEYRLPYTVLQRYAPLEKPAPGVIWRANLYKCADLCSHPHWLTWSPIDFPEPEFHMPSQFGYLEFN